MKFSKILSLALALVMVFALVGVAQADEAMKVALVTDVGNIDDKSFNQSAKTGLDKAVDELGITAKTAESKDANDFEANVQNMVDQDCQLIIGVGFSLAEAISKAAEENPDINFALVLDRMYKNKLKDGDLDNFTAFQIAQMRSRCEYRHAKIERLYNMSHDICV